MALLMCPECGTETHLDTIRLSADEFCPRCDYPLFWAPSSGPADEPELRRLPVADDLLAAGRVCCPECGEPNESTASHCLRCAAVIDPSPPPEPTPPVADDVDPIAPPSPVALTPPPAPSLWNPLSVGLAAVCGALTVTVALVALL